MNWKHEKEMVIYVFHPKKNEKEEKGTVVPKCLAPVLISIFRTQPPVGYRFPDMKSGQSVWTEQATTPLQGYADTLHWWDIRPQCCDGGRLMVKSH